MRKFLAVLLLAAASVGLGGVSVCAASDDIQSWTLLTLKGWRQGRWSGEILGEARIFDDVSDDGFYRVTPQLGYQWSDHLDARVHYTYLWFETENPGKGTQDWKNQHRLELELNPHWKVREKVQIHVRNRVEFRWIEDRGSDNTRLRQRWQIKFPLSGESNEPFFFASNELFYDFKSGNIVEDRAVPAGLGWRLNDRTVVQIFYLIQLQRTNNDWSSNQVFGTHAVVSF